MADVDLYCNEWSLPSAVIECYHSKGISTLFQWQAQCLSLPGVLDSGANLVYSAPTSAGKTLVAEILVLKRVLETRKKALIILPFVSVAREKMLYLQTLYGQANVLVDGYMSTLNPVGGMQSWDVAVCTIEKANGLINRLIEENSIDKIGAVVVDELHIVCEPNRGYLLELLLTKLLFMSNRDSDVTQSNNLQIIGMSATISNLDLLSRWLNAQLYTTDYRPVPLVESLAVTKNVYSTDNLFIRELATKYCFEEDIDFVIGFCLEAVTENHGVLIFCQTRLQCEKLAGTIAHFFCDCVREADGIGEELKAVFDSEKLPKFCKDFVRQFGDGHDNTSLLAKCVSFGVSFHHAGLTMEERDFLERGFRLGYLRVLVATSTLSSGVNLPAKRVIIRRPWGQPGKPASLTPEMYRQMVGRAGRKGLDVEGESILICKPSEVARGQQLMKEELAPIKSVLIGNFDTLKRALLESIVGGMVESIDAAWTYLECTLLATQLTSDDKHWQNEVKIVVKDTIEFLLQKSFVTHTQSDDGIKPTQLGTATVASSISPDQALVVFDDLKTARQSGLVLENELHMVYLVTPTYMTASWGYEFKWRDFADLWINLPSDLKAVGSRVGVTERFIFIKANQNFNRDSRMEMIHMRFYTALALYELINEVPFSQVAKKYGCNRGFLQSLQQQGSTFAGMVVTFCDRLGWLNLKTLLSGFAERLAFGIRRDLTELVQIDGLDGARARQFHSSGLTSITDIAQAASNDIVAVLRRAVPFDENLNTNKRPWLCGFPDMTEDEAAQAIVSRAQALLQENLRRLGVNINQVSLSQGPAVENNSVQTPLSRNFKKQVDEAVNQSPNINKTQLGVSNSNESPIICEQSWASSDSGFDILASQTVQPTTEEEIKDKDSVERSMSPLILDLSQTSISSDSDLDECTTETVDHNTAISAEKTFRSAGNSLSDSMMQRLFNEIDTPSPSGNHGGIKRKSPDQPQHNAEKDKPPRVEQAGSSLSESMMERMFKETDTPSPCDNSNKRKGPNQPTTPLLFAQNINCSHNENMPETGSLNSCVDSTRQPSLEMCGAIPARLSFGHQNNSSPSPVVKKRPKLLTLSDPIPQFPLNAMKQVKDTPMSTNGSFHLENVCSSVNGFERFKQNVSQSDCDISAVFSYEKKGPISAGSGISIKKGSKLVTGLAVCVSNQLVYYIDFCDEIKYGTASQETAFPAQTPVQEIRLEQKLQLVNLLFANTSYLSTNQIEQLCRFAHLIGCSFPDGDLFCFERAIWMLNLNLHRLLSVEEQSIIKHGKKSIDRLTACKISNICYRLKPKLKALLTEQNMENSLRTLQMPMTVAFVRMEMLGFGFDINEANKILDLLRKRQNDKTKRATQLAGRSFSLSSPNDISKVLFQELKLPAPNGSRGKRHYPTNKDVLEKLADKFELPRVILELRRIDSATRYLLPLIEEVKSGRIHGRFTPLTATGRIVMCEPNLQLVPKTFDLGQNETVSLRKLFIAQKDCRLVSADYSQLELRVLAHFSADQRLLQILNSPTGDVFKLIAACWKNCTTISDIERQHAKQVCYGIIYGMGARTLGGKLSITEKEAQDFLETFMAQFPGVRVWRQQAINQCRSCGHVTTISGRQRPLPNINSRNTSEKAEAERQAINTIIQGSAADLFIAATAKVDSKIGVRFGADCKLVMQLHDELILEVKEEYLSETVSLVKHSMEYCWDDREQLQVQMKVRIKIGTNWADLEDYVVSS